MEAKCSKGQKCTKTECDKNEDKNISEERKENLVEEKKSYLRNKIT